MQKNVGTHCSSIWQCNRLLLSIVAYAALGLRVEALAEECIPVRAWTNVTQESSNRDTEIKRDNQGMFTLSYIPPDTKTKYDQPLRTKVTFRTQVYLPWVNDGRYKLKTIIGALVSDERDYTLRPYFEDSDRRRPSWKSLRRVIDEDDGEVEIDIQIGDKDDLTIDLETNSHKGTAVKIGPTWLCPANTRQIPPYRRVVEMSPSLEEKPAELVAAVLPQPKLVAATKDQPAHQSATGVWWEHEIAQATGGYDANNNRTLINSFNLMVTGPTSVPGIAKDILEQCVSASATAGYKAFEGAPSPEIVARLGAAWAAFKTTIYGCLHSNRIGKEIGEKFEIGYTRRGRWVDGAVLKFDAESPSARSYRQIHSLIKDKLPDPLNKLISFYIGTQDFPKIDIKFDIPSDVRELLKALPDPKELRNFVKQAEELAADSGKKIASEIKNEADKLKKKLGDEFQRDPIGTASAPFRVAAQATEQAAKDFVEGMRQATDRLPKIDNVNARIEDGKLVLTVAGTDIDVGLPNVPLPKPRVPTEGDIRECARTPVDCIFK